MPASGDDLVGSRDTWFTHQVDVAGIHRTGMQLLLNILWHTGKKAPFPLEQQGIMQLRLLLWCWGWESLLWSDEVLIHHLFYIKHFPLRDPESVTIKQFWKWILKRHIRRLGLTCTWPTASSITHGPLESLRQTPFHRLQVLKLMTFSLCFWVAERLTIQWLFVLKQAIPRSRHISENERNGIIAANGTCNACKVPGRNLGPGIAPTCSLALLPKAHKRTGSLDCLREGEASVEPHSLHSAHPFCCRRDIKGPGSLLFGIWCAASNKIHCHYLSQRWKFWVYSNMLTKIYLKSKGCRHPGGWKTSFCMYLLSYYFEQEMMEEHYRSSALAPWLFFIKSRK